MWNGGHASQAGWLNSRLKANESNFDFSQLVESGTVLTDIGLGNQTFYLGIVFPSRICDDKLVIEEANVGGSLVVRGRDHGRIGGREGGNIPFFIPTRAWP